LEEIFIGGIWQFAGRDDSTLGSLHEFSALKRLGAAVDYLCSWFRSQEEELDETAPDIHEVLPNTLEELQLEVYPNFSWRSRPNPRNRRRRMNCSKTHPHLSAAGDDLREQLLEIAHHKDERYPNLKTVAVFHTFSERYTLPPEEELPEITEMFETFENAGIDLFCGAFKDPPLFGP
jgi:hypothetical protein